MLTSAIGQAFLHALAEMRGKITLPEIVEMEVGRVLNDMAEESLAHLSRHARQLSTIYRRKIEVVTPEDFHALQGIQERWDELSTVLARRELNNTQLRMALSRVLEHKLPSGANNEQFRDSYIWEEFKTLARQGEVYLISADNAFYQERQKKNGLANALRTEIQESVHAEIYPDLEGFLGAKGYTTRIDYATTVGTQLAEAVRIALAGEMTKTEVEASELVFTSIRAYTTVGRSQVALAFSGRAWVEPGPAVPHWRRHAFFVDGTALYNVAREIVSETRLRSFVWRYVRPYEPEELRELELEAPPDRDRFDYRSLR